MAISEFSYTKLVEMTGGFSDLVGKGSFAEVYKGHLNGRDVVVKQIILRNSADKKMWEKEKTMLIMFSAHDNIMQCYGYAEVPNMQSAFLVLELVPKKLRDVNEGKIEINWQNFIDIMVQTCDALIHIHRHDHVFVDLKPENVMFYMEEGVKLIDMGSVVNEGVADCEFYTPHYAAPEVSRKAGGGGRSKKNIITPKADVYNIGKTMIELLTNGAKEET